ncbi:hypothetical protein MKX03_030020, partial [Papaver bracteatum]
LCTVADKADYIPPIIQDGLSNYVIYLQEADDDMINSFMFVLSVININVSSCLLEVHLLKPALFFDFRYNNRISGTTCSLKKDILSFSVMKQNQSALTIWLFMWGFIHMQKYNKITVILSKQK